MTVVHVTEAILRDHGALCHLVDLFRELFPDGYHGEWTLAHQLFVLRSPLRRGLGWAWHAGIVPRIGMGGLRWTRANLFGADLEGANLAGADLRESDVRGSDLFAANLHGADLRGADLRGSDLCGADLRGAHLSGAHFCGAYFRSVDIRNLRADSSLGTRGDTQIRGAEFMSAVVDGIPVGYAVRAPLSVVYSDRVLQGEEHGVAKACD